jgi:CBS domain-containing protein
MKWTKKRWVSCENDPHVGLRQRSDRSFPAVRERRLSMKVRDVMRQRAVFCNLETTLAAAVDLMCKNGCGFLPVVGEGGNVIGVITDRDICIALGTQNKKPTDVLVREVMLPEQYTFPKLFTCTPDDDIHCVLKTIRIEKIRRVPVIDRDGGLLGILSMDDIVLRACAGVGKHDISCKDVVDAYKAICAHTPHRGKRPQTAAA